MARELVARVMAAGGAPPQTPTELGAALLRLGGFIDNPPADCLVTAGNEAANVIRFTLAARDRLGHPWKGRFLVAVWLAATAYGAPGGTQTTSFAAGTVVEELAADRAWLVLTDASGEIKLDVTVSGAGTRHLHHLVLGPVPAPKAATWTA